MCVCMCVCWAQSVEAGHQTLERRALVVSHPLDAFAVALDGMGLDEIHQERCAVMRVGEGDYSGVEAQFRWSRWTCRGGHQIMLFRASGIDLQATAGIFGFCKLGE